MRFSHQKCHSFGAKLRPFWVQSVVVLATRIWWGVENLSIGFGKTINRLYMNRSIGFEKTIIHFWQNDYSIFGKSR